MIIHVTCTLNCDTSHTFSEPSSRRDTSQKRKCPEWENHMLLAISGVQPREPVLIQCNAATGSDVIFTD